MNADHTTEEGAPTDVDGRGTTDRRDYESFEHNEVHISVKCKLNRVHKQNE